MKAYVLHDVNNFCLEDVDIPKIESDRVLVEVKVAGICGSDIARIYKDGTYHFPAIPGHEFSGKVIAVGNKVDPKWMDKRVGIFPLIPCRECECCKKKQYEMCKSYSYLGSREDGGYAQYVTVPQENLIELPPNVSYEVAAMLEPMAVAVHTMRKAQIMKDDTIVICGLGTIGLLLLMTLIEEGYSNILVIGNKDFQKKSVLKLGLKESNYWDSRDENVEQWILEKTKNLGTDIFFECVGKNETIIQALNVTIPGGTIILMGNPHSDINLKKEVYWKILRKQLTLKGTWNSSFLGEREDDWNYIIRKLEKGRLNPELLITHKLSFDKLKVGLDIMKNKTEDYIKIMIQNEENN